MHTVLKNGVIIRRTLQKSPVDHLISSVRLGKDRNTGVATVIGKKSTLNTTIKVDMGKQHTNQVFVDASGVSQTKLVTDKNGILTVPVKGMRTAEVNGYLGVFVPQTTKAPSATIEKASVYQGKGINLKTKVANSVINCVVDSLPSSGHVKSNSRYNGTSSW